MDYGKQLKNRGNRPMIRGHGFTQNYKPQEIGNLRRGEELGKFYET
jgi:hypothetical protein